MGCLYTLGWMPSPIALLMALAIFLWFTGLSLVSLLCLMRPNGVMKSEMTEKFCFHTAVSNSLSPSPNLSYLGHVQKSRRTLYKSRGSTPSRSMASFLGGARFLHVRIAAGLRSWGA